MSYVPDNNDKPLRQFYPFTSRLPPLIRRPCPEPSVASETPASNQKHVLYAVKPFHSATTVRNVEVLLNKYVKVGNVTKLPNANQVNAAFIFTAEPGNVLNFPNKHGIYDLEVLEEPEIDDVRKMGYFISQSTEQKMLKAIGATKEEVPLFGSYKTKSSLTSFEACGPKVSSSNSSSHTIGSQAEGFTVDGGTSMIEQPLNYEERKKEEIDTQKRILLRAVEDEERTLIHEFVVTEKLEEERASSEKRRRQAAFKVQLEEIRLKKLNIKYST